MGEKRDFFFEDEAYDRMTSDRESFENYNRNFNQGAFDEEDFRNSCSNMRQENYSSYECENPNRSYRDYMNVSPGYMYGQQQGRNNFDFRSNRFSNDPYSCCNDCLNSDYNNCSCNYREHNNYDYNNFNYDNCGCMNYGSGYPSYGYNCDNGNEWWIIILLLFWFCGGWGFCFF